MRNNAPLPQPQIGINPPHHVECHHAAVQPYRYITYDALENEWLGDPNRLHSFMDAADKDIEDDNGNNDNGNNDNGNNDTENASNNGTGEKKSNNEDNNNSGVVRYAPGTLVWVLLSKGKQKQKNKSGNNNIDNDIINSNNQSHSNAAATTKPSASAASALQKKGRDKKHVQSMSRKNNHQQKSNGDRSDSNSSNKNTTDNSNLRMDTVNDDTKATNKNGVENDNHMKQEINNNNNDNTDPPVKSATNKDNANKTVANGSHDGSMTKRIKPIHQDNTYGHSNRSELFLRARVISDSEDTTTTGDDDESLNIMDERRVLVRYSKGSTYRVHAYNLIPVLEPKFQNAGVVNESPLSNNDINNNPATITGARMISPCVIITPETHIYRRIAVLHTTPEDSFIEIGCDYGITVDRIRRSLEEGGDVPTVWPTIDNVDGVGLEDANKEEKEGQQTVTCLGLDKSTESIDIATERYPKCKFALADVLVPEEMSSIRTLCEQTLVGGAPSVIAIDVNGNREIDGVLQCLQSVMNERWTRQPRLIIVKSRFLYWDLKKE